jgi:hypothetical protein
VEGLFAVRLGIVLGACTAATVLLGPASAAPTRLHGGTTTVLVTLTDSNVTFTPSTAPAGTVVFKVANKGKAARNFTIGHKRTPKIAAGKSATLTVTLPTRGSYVSLSAGLGRALRLTGLLNVIEPCTQPATTTVNVRLSQDQSAITVSQSTVPCGTVTFVVTNAGPLPDNFQVFSDLPEATGSTPDLKVGQTARVTVRFMVKGIAHYQSGAFPPAEPEFDGDYGEEGVLTIV